MKYWYLLISFVFIINQTSAQYSFEHINSNEAIEVFENNKKLNYPFCGGLKLPEFSECDLDLDGKNDLVIFDNSNQQIEIIAEKKLNTNLYILNDDKFNNLKSYYNGKI